MRSLVKREIKSEHGEYLTKTENSIIDDPRCFWNYIHEKQPSSRIPGHMIWRNTKLEDPRDIVQSFCDSFSSVIQSKPVNMIFVPKSLNVNVFYIEHFNESETICAINHLKSKMNSGHDLIPSFLIRNCASKLAKPLTSLFNLSLSTGIFPQQWKIGRISPVFKKGNASLIENYRPICILSNFSKIFEHLLYIQIFHNVKPLISEHQHGFMSGRSTTTNLLHITQFISEAVDNREQIDVIYTDLSKAFDVIDHSLLICKLDSFGLSPSLLKLLSSYLSDRVNYVHYNGYTSTTYCLRSGVPQGSNLGPLLFNIFINDLLTSLECPALAYADDVKIYHRASNGADCYELQKNLTYLYDWCIRNGLRLNIEKCAVVSYAKVNNPILYHYGVDSHPIERKSTVSDLGVLFNNQLSFAEHIASICRSASKSLGFVIRSCRGFKNINTLKTLYFTLVRSKLEYCSIIWYPLYTYEHLQLERVQKRFLKYLSYKLDGTYPPRGSDYNQLLLRHQMISLQQRRDRYSAHFLFNTLRNIVDSPYLLSKFYFTVPMYNVRNFEIIRAPLYRTNLLRKAPIQHMIHNFNLYYSDPFC